MPELAEEAAEVSTTKFTTEAAMPRPARANIETKGLCAGEISRQGVTAMIAVRAPT